MNRLLHRENVKERVLYRAPIRLEAFRIKCILLQRYEGCKNKNPCAYNWIQKQNITKIDEAPSVPLPDHILFIPSKGNCYFEFSVYYSFAFLYTVITCMYLITHTAYIAMFCMCFILYCPSMIFKFKTMTHINIK